MKMNDEPFAAPPLDVGAQLLGLARAERGGRLVEDQEPGRRMARRPRDLDHLLLRQRQARRPWRADRCGCPERPPRAPRGRARSPACLQRTPVDQVGQLDREVLEDAKVRAERQLLMNEPQPRAHRRARRVAGRDDSRRGAASRRASAATRPPTIFISVLLPAPLPPISADDLRGVDRRNRRRWTAGSCRRICRRRAARGRAGPSSPRLDAPSTVPSRTRCIEHAGSRPSKSQLPISPAACPPW